MSKIFQPVVSGAGATLALLLANPAFADWQLNMRPGVTELSRQAYSMHMQILWVCILVAVAVFGVMLYSIVKFRRSQGAVPDTTLLHSTKVEIIWTTIPILILIMVAIPAAKALIKIEDMRNSDITIKVTGYQWKWQYEYLDQKVDFFSTLSRDSDVARQLDSGIDVYAVPDYLLSVDHPLVVPVGKKIRVLLTAADVIHSWWVPALGMKRDAIPGFVNEMWFKAEEVGIYRGQCAELCGRDHGFMPVVVEVKSQADYDTWLVQQQAVDAPAEAAPVDQPATI
ncbi:MAG: cytochrome c oxidase subunit II [Steroidobacteraceae bacterium]